MRRGKYNAHRVEVDGHKFASKLEARRYAELNILLKAGLIEGLELQPVFTMIVNGTKVGKYTADFRYYCKERHQLVYEETKGIWTEAARLRVKLFKALYPEIYLDVIKA